MFPFRNLNRHRTDNGRVERDAGDPNHPTLFPVPPVKQSTQTSTAASATATSKSTRGQERTPTEAKSTTGSGYGGNPAATTSQVTLTPGMDTSHQASSNVSGGYGTFASTCTGAGTGGATEQGHASDAASFCSKAETVVPEDQQDEQDQ
ncbi:hypothetical protein IAT40_004081 [Kwoniella sp. CBS 6097]